MAVWFLGRGCPRGHRPWSPSGASSKDRPRQVQGASCSPSSCHQPHCLSSLNSPLRQTRLLHQLGGQGEGEVGGSCWRTREETAGKTARRHFAWLPTPLPECRGRGLTWRELCAVRPRPEGAAQVPGGPGLSWAGSLCRERSLGDVWGAEGAGELSQAGSLLPARPPNPPSTQGSASVLHSKMEVNGPLLPQRRRAILGAVLGNFKWATSLRPRRGPSRGQGPEDSCCLGRTCQSACISVHICACVHVCVHTV